ncbi:DUF397 domain-containing protein [Streptomyces griseorubiginosus]|uniref:DUF397 domain-containing protein n=1 Tax=Streptomyces griseorubiginosus TaxID=67304 RepID=UPI00099EBFC9|nr:DUF397 domain-containing protein [Streptomyces griseorubiginosus]
MITSADSPLKWRRSTKSAQGNCVEVAFSAAVLVRDSKDPDGSVLHFSPGCWIHFLSPESISPLPPHREGRIPRG